MRRAFIAVLLAGTVVTATPPGGSARPAGPPADSGGDAKARCTALLGTALQGGTVESAKLVPEGAYQEKTAIPGPLTPLPAHCRVRAVMRPTADSEIVFEVWLPTENWNGRFWGIGAGGFAGTLILNEVATAVQYGYASYTTDTGHPNGDKTEIWAKGRPEKIIDYAWRGVHVTTVAAKEITRRFYGKPPTYSYFSSCSNGGRQGLMEAHRFPEDYDGILAGAPAPEWIDMVVTSFGWNAAAIRQAPILPAKAALLQSKVLEQCDGIDGVKDGLIVNPPECRVDLGKLQCEAGEDPAQCFSPAETDTLAKLYSGPVDSAGKSLYPGFSPGGEVGTMKGFGWESWLFDDPADPETTIQTMLMQKFMRDFVTNDPSWTADRFDPVRDTAEARRAWGSHLEIPPDYSAFQKRGGKILFWHGWSDAAIPPQATIRYVGKIDQTMGKRKADDFTRLFMLPGTQHCALGPVAWWANQGPAADPGKHGSDMGAALQRWVETGEAPEEIVAVRPADPFSVFLKPRDFVAERSLKLCAYPRYAKYDGKGDPKKAESYSCVKP